MKGERKRGKKDKNDGSRKGKVRKGNKEGEQASLSLPFHPVCHFNAPSIPFLPCHSTTASLFHPFLSPCHFIAPSSPSSPRHKQVYPPHLLGTLQSLLPLPASPCHKPCLSPFHPKPTLPFTLLHYPSLDFSFLVTLAPFSNPSFPLSH